MFGMCRIFVPKHIPIGMLLRLKKTKQKTLNSASHSKAGKVELFSQFKLFSQFYWFLRKSVYAPTNPMSTEIAYVL